MSSLKFSLCQFLKACKEITLCQLDPHRIATEEITICCFVWFNLKGCHDYDKL